MATVIEGQKEIANVLGLVGSENKRRLKNWRERLGLPMRLIGGRWFSTKEELELWYSKTFTNGAITIDAE